MKVVVSAKVVTAITGTADVRKLHQLLAYACDGRHAVLFEEPIASLNAWLQQVDEGSRAAYVEALRLSSRAAIRQPENAATVFIEERASGDWGDPVATLSLDDALALLNQPLGVLVENSENDWHFFQGIMRTSEREIVDRALERSWITALHGGGSTLPAQLEIRLSKPAEGLRTFVLFDSDRRHPSELEPTWAPVAPQACEGFNAERIVRPRMPGRFWMLRRRFIESYMPRVQILASGVAEETANAFFRMPRDARWHFNMKRGFDADATAENVGRSQDMYAAVSPEDRQLLKAGLGRKLAERYEHATTLDFDWDADARSESESAIPNLIRLL